MFVWAVDWMVKYRLVGRLDLIGLGFVWIGKLPSVLSYQLLSIISL